MIKQFTLSLFLLLFSAQIFAVNPDDLLEPSVAFKPTLTSISDNKIKATWDIADEYFMYRKRFKFESLTEGITLGEAQIPNGKVKDDPQFGRVETYRNQVAIEIPITRDASASNAIELAIKTVSQGCADAGICYPPQRQTLTLNLDAVKVAAKADSSTSEEPINMMAELGLSDLINTHPPIPPEEAFQVKLNTADGQLLNANWNITEGHYLYQNKIKLRIVSPKSGLTIGDLDLPPAVKEIDPTFGELNTYNEDFLVKAKVNGDTDLLTQDFMVKATYQGCSKLTGICYPPQHDTLKLSFNSAQLIKVASPSDAAFASGSNSSSSLLPVQSALAIDNAPMMDEVPGAAKQPSILAELNGASPISSSSPVSSSPAIGKSDLASALGISDLSSNLTPVSPDKAYIFDLTATDKNTLNARWEILEGHYLYQHKFKFQVVGNDTSVSLGKAYLPEGKQEFDEYFGDVITYNESFDAKVPVIYTGSNQPKSITVKTSYQGCSKLTGICYPPQSKTQTVNIPASLDLAVNDSSPTKTSTSAETSSASQVSNSQNANVKVSEQDGLMNKLLNGGFFNSLAIFFIAGLALTFTPCVFPMIPILSGIIAGQGSDNSTKKSFFLSLSYVLAMAVTYAIVGVIAALSGENLQVALQNPWVISAFAILFVLLSLSMFGFYELQMPASIQSKLTNISNSQDGGSMANAGVMGFLSALIVGPCVTAPLIAALVYIAQTKDVVLGGLSLFALGLGMGTPLLIIGTSAGKILPRAGAWMDNVKAGFGILMLAMGIWMLERILPFEIIVLLTGILIVFSAIYMGALDALTEASTGWKRFFKASGLVLLIYGVTLLFSAVGGQASLLKPLKGFTGGGSIQVNAEPQHLVFKKIKSVTDLDNALASAKQQNQAVMLDFYADWCISCKEMEHNTFTDKAVIESMKDTLLIQADVTLDDEQDKELNKRFGLFGPPAIIFFDKTGTENKPYRIVGYKGPKDFNDHVQQFKQTLN